MILIYLAAVLSLLPAPRGYALTFSLIVGPDLQADPVALAGVQEAVRLWEERLSDPITVTLEVDLLFAPPSAFAGANPVRVSKPYGEVRSMMITDGGGDESILAQLPTSLSANLPPGFELSGALEATKANLKALGFSGLDTQFGASDGVILFNSNAPFDFDRSDGLPRVARHRRAARN